MFDTIWEGITNLACADELKIGVDNMSQPPPERTIHAALDKLTPGRTIFVQADPWYPGEMGIQNTDRMIVCAYCNTRNEVSLSKCDSCGGSLSIENMEKGDE